MQLTSSLSSKVSMVKAVMMLKLFRSSVSRHWIRSLLPIYLAKKTKSRMTLCHRNRTTLYLLDSLKICSIQWISLATNVIKIILLSQYKCFLTWTWSTCKTLWKAVSKNSLRKEWPTLNATSARSRSEERETMSLKASPMCLLSILKGSIRKVKCLWQNASI